MTICIAGVGLWKGQKVVLLCSDYQGTRPDYKAEDTYKFWHFHTGRGAIAFAGDEAAGKEFMRRCTAVTREFADIEKTRGDGDMDLRVGQYLAKVRNLAAQFKRERADHYIRTKYGLSLDEFYSRNAPERFLPQHCDEIFGGIKSTDLGAEFLIAYIDDEEPLFIRVEQGGYAYVEDRPFTAIGSGEPLAASVLSQIEGDDLRSFEECLTWVYQAKLTAERNQYVGSRTVLWALFPTGEDLLISDQAWEVIENSVPRSTLAPVPEELGKLGDGMFSKYRGPQS